MKLILLLLFSLNAYAQTSLFRCNITNSSLAVTGNFLTDAQLRITPLPVSGTTTCNAGTGIFSVAPASQLVSGFVPVKLVLADGSDFYDASGGGVGGGLTDTELRTSPVPTSVSNFPATQAVTGTFWQATQPVSGSLSVSNFPGTQPVSGTFWQATQPVSGTFFQATQPVSIASMPSTPVTGTFWQVTQPVSGAFWQATQPVSGTFFQATQPVSIASMPSTPVTGTFWQATQPVSGTLTANIGTSGSLALEATQTSQNTLIGAVTEAAPASDTASSGLNGRLQRIAQRITSLISALSDGTQKAKVTDGTDDAEVTAGSAAAAAANKALVVSQNPVGGNPCFNPSATLVSLSGSTSGTTAVQVLALSGSTKIYLCSLNVVGVSGTNPTFSLVQGTGANCASGQTVLIQAWATTAAVLYSFDGPVAVGVAGNALCYLDAGTTPIQRYTLTYVQQ